MTRVFGFAPLFLILLLAIANSNCQCASEMCEKTSLSLRANTKLNYTLDGYVIEVLSVQIWEECFNICLKKCQCLSFNVNEVNITENCELNDANTKLTPKALKEKEGVTYYELVRNYYDKHGVAHQSCSELACHNECCDSAPCQHGGTCSEVCDSSQRRFNCTCPPDYTGHKCQFPVYQSCKDVLLTNKLKINGVYFIMDQHNKSFPVFCDFGSEPGFVWTLIQSHSLENNDAFRSKAFYLHDLPINQDAPEWESYRLSMSRMTYIGNSSTHWRATCNFPTNGVDYQDYARTSLDRLDLFAVPDAAKMCRWFELINIRGITCMNCTAVTGYSELYDLHIDSWRTDPYYCDFDGRAGAVEYEDNFGYYRKLNPNFRCSSSPTSTTQYWYGAN
ncbi:hypothetical protein ACROYT_G026101 [Oculina patagonica]